MHLVLHHERRHRHRLAEVDVAELAFPRLPSRGRVHRDGLAVERVVAAACRPRRPGRGSPCRSRPRPGPPPPAAARALQLHGRAGLGQVERVEDVRIGRQHRYIVPPTTSGADSCPRFTPVEKVNATCRRADVLRGDLVEARCSGCWRGPSPASTTGPSSGGEALAGGAMLAACAEAPATKAESTWTPLPPTTCVCNSEPPSPGALPDRVRNAPVERTRFSSGRCHRRHSLRKMRAPRLVETARHGARPCSWRA